MQRKIIVAVATAMLASGTGVLPPDNEVAAASPAEHGRAEPAPASSGAGEPRIELAEHTGEHLYLVRFAAPAVPEFIAGKPALQARAFDDGRKLDAHSLPVRAYDAALATSHATFLDAAASAIGRAPHVEFDYTFAVNGMAVRLTATEVRALAKLPGVVSITPDKQRHLTTDSGPTWVNADAAWNATLELGLPDDYRGEGMVIGVIDTGISPLNPSFADVGADGYDHSNPLGTGVYLGVCAGLAGPDQLCNDKLIGIWDFVGGGDGGIDYQGHGSHTASTAGGNHVDGVLVDGGVAFDISGVAPHANIISYLGCCSLAGLTGSIDQAIQDGVDVINYSIGASSPSALWDDFDSVGFLNAREAGIFVVTSAGNDGSGSETVGSPGDAPWITSVGATTHNRWNGNSLTGLTSSQGGLPDILGKGATGPLGPTPIVDAASVGDPYCLDTAGHAEFNGTIVVCTRGQNGRVEKSYNVAAQGAVGFVLIQDEPNAGPGGIVGDAFAVPGVAISSDHGVALRDWLAQGTGHMAAISGVSYITGAAGEPYADILASFSSRGANRAVDVLVPSVTAPGVDILAALTDTGAQNGGVVYGMISGTSMASPHVAGAGALIMQARPDWTPAQIQSALMTTAAPEVRNHTGEPATPYQQGSGRIDVGAAIVAGLLFDETIADYQAADPELGGDPRTLNLPSFVDSECLSACTWTRTATVPADALPGVTWTPTVEASGGVDVDVVLDPPGPVDPGDTLTITVTADVSAAVPGATYFGRITLTPDAEHPAATLPLAVGATDAILPEIVEIDTRRDAGSYVVPGIVSTEITDVTGTIGWHSPTEAEGSLVQDPTPDPFPSGAYNMDGGVDVYVVDVSTGDGILHAALSDAAAPDLDLFVGAGTVPSEATELCYSASLGSDEACLLTDLAPGSYWIMVHSYEGTTPTADDAYTLAYTVAGVGANGTGTVVGPGGTVPTGEPYDVTLTWNLPTAQPGDRWFGVAMLDGVGTFPVALSRLEDDVTKVSSVGVAEPGDHVEYTIAVQPNVTPTDLEYTIVDTVPDGLTVDPASVPAGGVVAGQTITWTLVQPTVDGIGPTPVPVELTYTVAVDPGAFGGTYTNTVRHTIDDPFSAAVEVTADVVVDGPAKPAPTVPSAPTGVTAIGGDASATVSWAAPPDGGAPIESYTVTSDPGAITCSAPATSTACVVPGLTNGTAYTFTVTATNAVGTSSPSAPSLPVTPGAPPVDPADPLIVPVQPSRLFDTRPTEPQWAIEVGKHSYGGDDVLRVNVLGHAGIPTDGVGGLALNVTAVDAFAPGFVTVYPCGARPVVSNINYAGPGAFPNAVIAPVSEAGELCFYSKQPVHLIADVVGWFPSEGGIGMIDPSRLFDTRTTEPTWAIDVAKQPYGGESNVLRVDVTGVAGVPEHGVGAVSLNVTAVDPLAAGYVTVYPCGVRPTVSNINYAGPGAYPNAVIAPVSADGEICFFSKQPTDLIADVNAWFPTGDDFWPVTPARLFDTRATEPAWAIDVAKQKYGGESNVLRVKVTGTAGVPEHGVGLVSLNVTALDPLEAGFVTVYPCGVRPTVSSVNYSGPGVYPNAVIVPVSADGEVCFFSKVPTDLIADVNGWFASG